jgi:hypothetical protein
MQMQAVFSLPLAVWTTALMKLIAALHQARQETPNAMNNQVL